MSARLAAVVVVLALAGHAAAQAPGTVSSSASITGVGQFNTDLDKGGDFDWYGGIVSASFTRQVSERFSAGASIKFGYEHWNFSSNNVAFGGHAPWTNVVQPQLGASFTYAVQPDVIVNVSPSFGWAYATGASTGDALVWGALASATKVFSPDQMVGLGVGVFRQIDKTRVYPLLIVDWKFDEHWRVANPFPAGPTGGAGIEVVYAFDERWSLAGGGAFRQTYFRLSKDGPYPDGIGETQAIPLFARLSYKVGTASRLDFYAGALVSGKLTVKDSRGNDVTNDEFKAAPIMGMTLATRF